MLLHLRLFPRALGKLSSSRLPACSAPAWRGVASTEPALYLRAGSNGTFGSRPLVRDPPGLTSRAVNIEK
jgi:hypothetical protein